MKAILLLAFLASASWEVSQGKPFENFDPPPHHPESAELDTPPPPGSHEHHHSQEQDTPPPPGSHEHVHHGSQEQVTPPLTDEPNMERVNPPPHHPASAEQDTPPPPGSHEHHHSHEQDTPPPPEDQNLMVNPAPFCQLCPQPHEKAPIDPNQNSKEMRYPQMADPPPHHSGEVLPGSHEHHHGSHEVTPAPTPRPASHEIHNPVDVSCDLIQHYHCEFFVGDPVCGTDFMTYDNMCYFSKAHCAMRTIDLGYHGACRTPATSAPVATDAPLIPTDAPVLGTGDPVMTDGPVVGTGDPVMTDGPVVGTVEPVMTVGPVVGTDEPAIPTGAPVVANPGGDAVHNFFCMNLSHQQCGTDQEILCGTDGVTYTNLCLFEKARCLDGTLAVASYIACPANPIQDLS